MKRLVIIMVAVLATMNVNAQSEKTVDAYAQYVAANEDSYDRYKNKLIDRDELKAQYAAHTRKYLEGHTNDSIGVKIIENACTILNDKDLVDISKMLTPLTNTDQVAFQTKYAQGRLNTAEGMMFSDLVSTYKNKTKKDKLSDYVGKGKYVLVDFWASWCAPCRMEIPNVIDVYNKYKGDDFEVVGVCVMDKPESSKKAIKEEKVPYPQIIGVEADQAEIYGINAIPHIILFGPDGTILRRGLRGTDIDKVVGEYLMK